MSNYLTLENVKNHIRVDSEFTDEDNYITGLMDAAELAVARKIDCPLVYLEDENKQLPQPLIQAMLLLVGTWYNFRESVNTASTSPVDHALDMLCDLYHEYNFNGKHIN